MESTESVIELKLDTHRNYMLRVNIQIAMGSMALALGTTISGLFGANLVNGLEEHPHAFYWLALLSGSAICALYLRLSHLVERSIPRTLEGQSADSIFSHLDEIHQVLGLARSRRRASDAVASLSRAELNTLLRNMAVRCCGAATLFC